MAAPVKDVRMIGKLDKANGRGKYKVFVENVDITGSVLVDTGMEYIQSANVSIIDSGSSMPVTSASIVTISEPMVGIVATQHNAAPPGLNAVSAAAHHATLVCKGYCHSEPEQMP